MTAWVLVIHRVPLAIGIGVEATSIERTQIVRAVEPHQRGVECSITVTQMVMSGDWIPSITLETEHTLARQVIAIRRIYIFCVHQAWSSSTSCALDHYRHRQMRLLTKM